MGIVARHADVYNNMAVFQADLPRKVEALRRRCEEVGRDFDEIEISQQCLVVIGEDEDTARAHLVKAQQIYGCHMGAAREEHGIRERPQQVIERIERHRALGVPSFPIATRGRTTREVHRLIPDAFLPAHRE